MTSRSLGHRAPILWVLLPLIAGLVAGQQDWLPLPPAWLATGAVAFAAWAAAGRRCAAPCMVLSVFLCGAALYEIRRGRLPDWDALPPREVRIAVEIDRLFPPHADSNGLSGLGRLRNPEPHLAELEGQRVYFAVRPPRDAPAPEHPAVMEVTGVLRPLPRSAPTDTFDGYLAGQGMNFKLTRARVTGKVVRAGAYQIFCDRTLARFSEILGRGIERHAAAAAVSRAMLLGRQNELSEEQKTMFRESGTMHLFSISGLHIAVIAGVIHIMFSLARVPNRASVAAGGVLLWLYVDITGGTPSAVRAFLMVMFLQAARVLRRPGNPVAALAASAVCVLLVEPMQLFGASFQLSYGIVAALLMLGLPLADLWIEKTEPFASLPKVSWTWKHHAADISRRWLLSYLAIGLSSAVAGLISGVTIFGLFTPVALLANLALIPLGSLVIVAGFLSLVCGLVGLTPAVVLLNHAGALTLSVIEKCAAFFASLPGASTPARFAADWIGFAAFGALLGLVLAGYAQGWRARRGGYWLPFGFAALTLLVAMRPGT